MQNASVLKYIHKKILSLPPKISSFNWEGGTLSIYTEIP